MLVIPSGWCSQHAGCRLLPLKTSGCLTGRSVRSTIRLGAIMIAPKPSSAPTSPASFRLGDERLIKVSPTAAKKVSTLLQKQGRPAGVLRVAVIGGGCSGLQYKMDLQDHPPRATFWWRAPGSKWWSIPKAPCM